MKQHTVWLLYTTKAINLCIVFFLLSCVNSIKPEDENNPAVPVTLSTKIFQNDKNSGETEFQEKDQIGMYVLTNSSTLNEERFVDNARLVYSASAGFQSDKAIFFPENGQKCDFICYYPYQQAGIQENKTTMEVCISPDQSELTNFRTSDFMTALTKDVSPGEQAIDIAFNHKLYLMNILIKPGVGYTAGQLLEMNPFITIKQVCTHAIYDFANDKFNCLPETSDIIPFGEWIIEDGKLTGKSVILVPQELPGQHIFIEITADNRSFEYTLTEKYELEKGRAEDLTITLIPSQEALQCTLNPSINGWGEPKKKEGNANENPTFININSLTFTESFVYQVLNNGSKVAEIVKEYLLTDHLARQAITIYPVQNGKTDLGKGIVLNLIGVTEKKHGGNLVWNEPENTLIYTEGNSSPITHIYITPTGKIETNRPGNALRIELKPDRITDTRGTETMSYPIVKIGTQYWMRGNLKTGKYTDGSSIPKSSDFQDTSAKYYPYGVYCFYNSAVVNSGLLSPAGWRVGNTTDWQKLEQYIGGDASVLKNGNSWMNSTNPVNNLSGFNAVATGYYTGRTYTAEYKQIGFWITNNENHQTNGFILLDTDHNSLKQQSALNTLGLSVRCIRE